MDIHCVCLCNGMFKAPSGIKAPANDFDLIKKIHNFKKIDPEIANAVMKKFLNHLWYLSSENIGFAFFDNLPNALKERMVKALDVEKEDNEKEKYECTIKHISHLLEVDLSYFVSSKTKSFFQRSGLNMSFLNLPPAEWSRR